MISSAFFSYSDSRDPIELESHREAHRVGRRMTRHGRISVGPPSAPHYRLLVEPGPVIVPEMRHHGVDQFNGVLQIMD